MGAEFGFETGDSQLLEELLDKLEMQVGEEKGSVGQWEIPVQWAQSPLASEAPAAQGIAAACNDAGIPASILATPSTPNRTNCLNVAGVANPQQVVAQAVARAVAMLDNTIAELVKARSAICAGQVPGWPLLGDVTADWLTNRLGVCVDSVRVWTAGTFKNGSVAEVIRRLLRVRNLIASNTIRYVCNDATCAPDDWAFVLIDPTCHDTPPTIVRLCHNFWVAGAGVDAHTHAEFQAQTVIHEASHLYHCTTDVRGASIGVAECVAQFVAATNGSPIDPAFQTRCAISSRCKPPAAPLKHEFSGIRTGTPVSRLAVVRVAFNPRNAIRLKGRPALRQ